MATGQQWTAAGAGALGEADLGMAYALLEEVAINPTMELPEHTQDWGNRLLGGHKQKLVHTRTQEKEAVTPKDTDPDLPVGVQGSLVACCRVRARENPDPLDLSQNFHFSGFGEGPRTCISHRATDAAASDHTLRTAASLARSRAPGS